MNKLKRNIQIYYIFTFFNSFVLFGAILIPFYKEWGGMSQPQIQLLQSIFMVALFLFEVPTGVLADKIGRKISICLGSIFGILGILIYSTTPNFWVFALGECTVALGSAFISGANQSIIYDSLKSLGLENKAKKTIANAEIFSMFGILAGNLLGPFLTQYFDLNVVFALTVAPLSLALISSFFFYEPQTSYKESLRWMNLFKTGIKNVVSNKKLRIITLDLIITSALAYYVVWFYQLKLINNDIDITYFGIFGGILVIAEALILKFQNKLENLFGGEKNYLIFTTIITAFGFILCGFYNHWLSVVALLIFSGGFGLTRKSIYYAVINRFLKSESRATTISTINLFRSLLVAIINPFWGYLVDWDLNFTFLLTGLFLLIGTLVSIKATKEIYK